ncbi:MAG: hypothetical protein JNM18_09155 [Planctomycetaceae bacterium]|nr:hypothetical protein [Planctomycetaceae bacterium]
MSRMLWLMAILSSGLSLAIVDNRLDAAEPRKHLATFDDQKRPGDWGVNCGHWEPEAGVLVVRELKSDEHAAASRWRIPMQDGVVRLRAKFAGGKAFHVGFDPQPGTLKKQGHLYSLVVTPESAQIKKHRDKSDAKSKDETLATGSFAPPADGWFPLELRTEGDRVQVTIGNATKLEATDPTFHVAKPTVVFRVMGGDVHFDDVEVTVAK